VAAGRSRRGRARLAVVALGDYNWGKQSERRVQSPELPGLSYNLALFNLNAL